MNCMVLPAACSASFVASAPVSTSTSRWGRARRSDAASSVWLTPGSARTSTAVERPGVPTVVAAVSGVNATTWAPAALSCPP